MGGAFLLCPHTEGRKSAHSGIFYDRIHPIHEDSELGFNIGIWERCTSIQTTAGVEAKEAGVSHPLTAHTCLPVSVLEKTLCFLSAFGGSSPPGEGRSLLYILGSNQTLASFPTSLFYENTEHITHMVSMDFTAHPHLGTFFSPSQQVMSPFPSSHPYFLLTPLILD